MNNATLYGLAIVIAGVVGAYYYYSGEREKLNVQKRSNMMYATEQVRLLQTDEHGQLAVQATVGSLQQDLKTQRSEMSNVQANMYKNQQVDSTFIANKVQGYDDNQKIVLTDQVIATKNSEHGQMQFKTDELTAYPKQRLIETSHQVVVQSPQASFSSQGLKADLNAGQYEFYSIRGLYDAQ